MPERKNKLYRKVDSEEVQGEGSWVLLKSPTLDEIRGAEMPADGDTTASVDFGASILGQLVKDWNWVDDDGEPMPKPTPELVAKLPYAEIMFLMDSLDLEKLTDTKN